MNQKQIAFNCRNSCFSLAGSKADIHLRDNFFNEGLGLYLDYDNQRDCDIITYATPEFQRSNDKWSIEKKVLFLQNILKGFRSEIILFRFGEVEDCMIMDGLQRLTAIKDFFDDKFKVFGLFYSEFEGDLKILLKSRTLTIKNITFNNWKDVGRFYIDINEGITHSDTDIQKCKDWFFGSKAITL